MATPDPATHGGTPLQPADVSATDAARCIALQMFEERGRGAVLVGVARVDSALEHLLWAVMAAAPNRGEGLFLPDRPLGSLGAKVAHAVGPSQKQSQIDLSLTAAPVHLVLKINCSAVDLVESVSQNPSTIVWA